MPTAQIRRSRIFDRAGRYLIAAGGIGVIAAVLGIFVFITRETFPLFLGARHAAEPAVAVADGSGVHAIGIDPNREVAFTLDAGGIHFYDRAGDDTGADEAAPAPVTAAYRSLRDGRIALGLEDGRVWTGTVDFQQVFYVQVSIARSRINRATITNANFTAL